MKKQIFIIFLTFYSFSVSSTHLNAQARNQVFVGARPLGLGETFVAIADDGNAAYWNPAGLPSLRHMEINSMFANPYNISGLKNAYLSFVYPITDRQILGLNYFHYGYDDPELQFLQSKATFSLGTKVMKNLFIGMNLKYVHISSSLDNYMIATANGFGFDLGGLYCLQLAPNQWLRQINFGIMGYDLHGTSVRYSGSSKAEKIFPQNFHFGLAFFPPEQIRMKWLSLNEALLALDIDDRVHLGVEAWLAEHLAVRAGIQKDLQTKEPNTYSFGTSLKLPYLGTQLDYAYIIPPTLSPTHVFSLGLFTTVSPVKLSDIELDDMYASFYKTYANKPIGSVTIRNDFDKELPMTVSITVPGLSDVPTQERLVIRPFEKQRFDIKVVLSEAVLQQRESAFRQLKIRAEYTLKNENRFAEATKKFLLYGRGATTWDDPSKAAAFITRMDRMVRLFSMAATSELPYRSELELGNIYTAATLFDALGVIGMKYREDPDNPFSSLRADRQQVDYIKYPAETLDQRCGDCDDLTVLYASLLEHCGIRTALLSMPGHITLMFDSGIHARNWGVLPVGDTLVVVRNNSLWIPVEVTWIGQPFLNAWQEAGRKYRTALKEGEVQIVMVSDVEGIYLSALPQDLQSLVPALPDRSELQHLLGNDFSAIENLRTVTVVGRYQEALKKNPGNLKLRNKLGIILAQQDSLFEAKQQFLKMLDRDNQNFAALNNLGNVEAILGGYPSAEQHYRKAAALQPDSAGTALNLAILYQLWKSDATGDSFKLQQQSEQWLQQAFNLLKSDAQSAMDLIGIPKESIEWADKADFKSELKQKMSAIAKFIRTSAAQHLFNKPLKGARLEQRAVKRGPDPDRGYLLWWAEMK
ncbi:MAG: PorV/PorQ family protein [candidate division KSB1 bacterium]|nr:PorV/PorQ family protein [candidate division KSB1 bacterium]MDZ7356853.1 PorV/PorQ family protein [candidate division KSB1 bacterium]MDZ7401308.1 PorV/PorQ family protein [candidate division KSB1 bacterium]